MRTGLGTADNREGFRVAHVGDDVVVLIADDDDDGRRVLAKTLETAGFTVVQVDDGDTLAARLAEPERPRRGERRACRPDVVISDVSMPGADPIGVLSAQRGGRHPVPFILITAFGHAGLRDHARRSGAVALFDKPFDVDDLLTVVVNCVAPHSLAHAVR